MAVTWWPLHPDFVPADGDCKPHPVSEMFMCEEKRRILEQTPRGIAWLAATLGRQGGASVARSPAALLLISSGDSGPFHRRAIIPGARSNVIDLLIC